MHRKSRPTINLPPILSALNAGDTKLGEALARKALKKDPGNVEALHLCGVACLLRNKAQEAEQLLERALARQKSPAYYLNLALARQKLGKDCAAESYFQNCLELQPNNAQAANNLGNICFRQHRFDEAEKWYLQAIAGNPGYVLAYQSLGQFLSDRGRSEEAIAILQLALAQAPDSTALHCAIATAFEIRKRYAEAATHLRKVAQWSRLQQILRLMGDWSDLSAVDDRIIAGLNQTPEDSTSPWGLINIPQLTASHHREAGRAFAEKKWSSALHAKPLAPSADEGPRLRIGYLSSDFYDHATMHLMMGVLEAHDSNKVDVQLFDHSPKREDAFTSRLAELGFPRHDLNPHSDKAAAQLISDQQLHLLVDLKGYTTKARLGICGHRPAPVIVSWLGYPGSLGHPRLADYIIGDPTVSPVEHAAHFSEHIAQMPHCYQPNDRRRPLDLDCSRVEAGLPETALVFCSFNQLLKLNPAEFDLWCQLLSEVPGSVLWLLDPNSPEAQSNLRSEMSRRKVDPDRLIFAPRLSQAAHIARLALADIALDSFPYTSHTTGSDALWAGVPLIARMGDTFASRVSVSLLRAHGFDELVAKNEADYRDKLIALAHDGEQRSALRRRLQQARLTSPLFDTARFTRDLEALYAAIWDHHQHAKTDKAPVIARQSYAVS